MSQDKDSEKEKPGLYIHLTALCTCCLVATFDSGLTFPLHSYLGRTMMPLFSQLQDMERFFERYKVP